MIRATFSGDLFLSILGMVQNRPFALDSFVSLPVAGLRDFVEGEALHTSRRTVKLI